MLLYVLQFGFKQQGCKHECAYASIGARNQHNAQGATRKKHNIMDVKTVKLKRPLEGNELSRHNQRFLLEIFLENRKVGRD